MNLLPIYDRGLVRYLWVRILSSCELYPVHTDRNMLHTRDRYYN